MINRRGVLGGLLANAFTGLAMPHTALAEDCWHTSIVNWENYLTRRGDLDDKIDKWRKSGKNDCPRITEWISFMDMLRPFRGLELKAALVNGWCNAIIAYDLEKIQRLKRLDNEHSGKYFPAWFETPFDTLRSGKGVCVDIALLKFETLMRIGFKQGDIRYVYVKMIPKTTEQKEDWHAVVMGKVDTKVWVLNDNQCNEEESPVKNFINECFIEPELIAFSRESKATPSGYIMQPIWSTDGVSVNKVCSNTSPQDSVVTFYNSPPNIERIERETEEAQFKRLTTGLNGYERCAMQKLMRGVVDGSMHSEVDGPTYSCVGTEKTIYPLKLG